MTSLLIKIFIVGFFLNLLYEVLHSVLYKTCLEAHLKRYVYLMLKGSIFDGLAITIIYFASLAIFREYYIFAFLTISLLFAYIWEIYSLKVGKWEYSEKMPKVLGAGLTPLVQLILTGILSIYISFNFLI